MVLPLQMFSQRNNPYCDLLHFYYLQCKDRLKEQNKQIFLLTIANCLKKFILLQIDID